MDGIFPAVVPNSDRESTGELNLVLHDRSVFQPQLERPAGVQWRDFILSGMDHQKFRAVLRQRSLNPSCVHSDLGIGTDDDLKLVVWKTQIHLKITIAKGRAPGPTRPDSASDRTA